MAEVEQDQEALSDGGNEPSNLEGHDISDQPDREGAEELESTAEARQDHGTPSDDGNETPTTHDRGKVEESRITAGPGQDHGRSNNDGDEAAKRPAEAGDDRTREEKRREGIRNGAGEQPAEANDGSGTDGQRGESSTRETPFRVCRPKLKKQRPMQTGETELPGRQDSGHDNATRDA